MKRNSFTFFALGLGALALMGCQKEVQQTLLESQSEQTSILELSSSDNWEVKDGILSFENEGQLNKVLNQLALLSQDQLLDFEAEHGYRSLSSIFHMITQAEVEHQERFFEGLNPDLESAELEQMGYHYEPTQLYKLYLSKNVIAEKISADGAREFALNIGEPGYNSVLNENGEVIVGNEKWSFEKDGTRIQKLDENGKPAAEPQMKITLNHEFDFTRNARRSGYESWSGSVYWITDPAKGSNYRYYAQTKFSSTYTTTSLSNTYYWHARAEQKKWGNWATRNDYNPIWGISASWSYDYWIIYNGAGFGVVRDGATYPLPNGSGWATSPYYLSSLNTNYTVRYMHPHNTYTLSGSPGYTFFDNVRVYNHSFVYKFSGGCCGYNYTGI